MTKYYRAGGNLQFLLVPNAVAAVTGGAGVPLVPNTVAADEAALQSHTH